MERMEETIIMSSLDQKAKFNQLLATSFDKMVELSMNEILKGSDDEFIKGKVTHFKTKFSETSELLDQFVKKEDSEKNKLKTEMYNKSLANINTQLRDIDQIARSLASISR